jgi:DNA-binding NtrC family response regulator
MSLCGGPAAGAELGVSPAIMKVELILRRIALIDSTVLLSGPSGSGKEVAARFIHGKGERAGRPFMAINCAAIPADLLESELFGHERGAFTGAHARRIGLVELAAQGTLFLDEIAELPVPMQAKLLRLLEERTYARVGGEQALQFAARVIAATNARLSQRVKTGAFREDLYFRLNVIEVAIPSLAQRPEDILPLALRFAGEFAQRFYSNVLGFTAAAETALLSHDYPGNVRELRNRIERAVALASSQWIDRADLFPEGADSDEEAAPVTLAQVREQAERRHIASVLNEVGGDVERAADRLGVSRSTLFDKIRRFGLRA